MFNLVTHKLLELELEYKALMHHGTELIEEALKLSDALSHFGEDDIEKLRLLGMKLLLQQWSAFRRRLVMPLSGYLDGIMECDGCNGCRDWAGPGGMGWATLTSF